MDPGFLVGAGGALGATCRYVVGVFVRADSFPLATLGVNVAGSFLLGLVVFSGAAGDAVLFLGVGFAGAFTTFSSFSFRTVDLWERDERRLAIANALGTLALSMVALGLAWLLVG